MTPTELEWMIVAVTQVKPDRLLNARGLNISGTRLNE